MYTIQWYRTKVIDLMLSGPRQNTYTYMYYEGKNSCVGRTTGWPQMISTEQNEGERAREPPGLIVTTIQEQSLSRNLEIYDIKYVLFDTEI